MLENSHKNITQKAPKLDIAILLVPGFSVLSFGGILEPFKYLEQWSTDCQIRTTVYSADGQQIANSVGLLISCTKSAIDLRALFQTNQKPSAVFICCGLDVKEKYRNTIKHLLRDCRLHGVRIFGLGSAAWLMAETNTLPDGEATIHWTSMQAFAECNQDIEIKNHLFVSNGRATSCAGELASLDMVIDYIRCELSAEIAERICNHLLVSFPRGNETRQPGSPSNRLRRAPAPLRRIVEIMVKNLEETISIKNISEIHGLSVRQIERLFAKHLCCSPRRYYVRLRLELAHQLVEQSDLPLVDISLASGFNSPARLSQLYKLQFGMTPTEVRSKTKKRWSIP